MPDGIKLGVLKMKKIFFSLALAIIMAVGSMALCSYTYQTTETSIFVITSIPKGYNYVKDVTAYTSAGAGDATVKRVLKLYEKEGDYILVISNNEYEPVNKNPLYGSDLNAGWRNSYEYKAGKWFFNM